MQLVLGGSGSYTQGKGAVSCNVRGFQVDHSTTATTHKMDAVQTACYKLSRARDASNTTGRALVCSFLLLIGKISL